MSFLGWQIIPLAFMREGSLFRRETPAVLDGMKDDSAEQTLSRPLQGADSAEASMDTSLMRESAVMGETSSQVIEGE